MGSPHDTKMIMNMVALVAATILIVGIAIGVAVCRWSISC